MRLGDGAEAASSSERLMLEWKKAMSPGRITLFHNLMSLFIDGINYQVIKDMEDPQVYITKSKKPEKMYLL